MLDVWPQAFFLQLVAREGVHPPPGAASARWCDRAQPEAPRPEVQLRQDDLQEVLRPPPPQGHQLQEEGVRPHLQHPPQEEAEVEGPLPSAPLVPWNSPFLDSWIPEFWISGFSS